MQQPISWGILGCARIARKVMPAIRGSRNGRLGAIASRDAEKAALWAADFQIPRAYGSYEELLADPAVQAVYLPLPNELHRPWTLAAAQAGKHVLCDKPLALDAAQAEEMVAACREHGVRLMEAFMWRHHPRTARLLDLVRNGSIGRLRLVRCSFSFDVDRSDWRLDPARGGGSLRDVGCYGVNTCRLMCGAEPESVEASAIWWPSGVDMTMAATLRFPGGVLGQLDSSLELPYRCAFELVGTEGVLEVPDAYVPGDTPAIRLHRGDGHEVIRLAAADQYQAMVEHFADAILAGNPVAPPAEDGLANMRVLDAVMASARRDR